MGRAASRKRKSTLLGRIVLLVVCIVIAILVSGLATASYMGVFNGNVREVYGHELYRSGQLRGEHLHNVLVSKGIHSVINLRGFSHGDDVLTQERAECRRMGINHVDIKFSAQKLPPPENLQMLLQCFDSLPRPILIHCAGGSDRSGLACTLYQMTKKGVGLSEARSSQLTWRYGHIPHGSAHAMDDFFDLYEKTSRGHSIRDWVFTEYPRLYALQTRK